LTFRVHVREFKSLKGFPVGCHILENESIIEIECEIWRKKERESKREKRKEF
jgi:hypothetical protein